MSQRSTLTEAADQVGNASALLARYRSLLAGAANLDAPVVAHAINDLRRTATALECAVIALSSAKRRGQPHEILADETYPPENPGY